MFQFRLTYLDCEEQLNQYENSIKPFSKIKSESSRVTLIEGSALK